METNIASSVPIFDNISWDFYTKPALFSIIYIYILYPGYFFGTLYFVFFFYIFPLCSFGFLLSYLISNTVIHVTLIMLDKLTLLHYYFLKTTKRWISTVSLLKYHSKLLTTCYWALGPKFIFTTSRNISILKGYDHSFTLFITDLNVKVRPILSVDWYEILKSHVTLLNLSLAYRFY